MVLKDRKDAGERLAAALARHFGSDALVLGIPRGGVVVAFVVAEALGATLDVVVPHKLGAPHNSELAIGGVTYDGTVVTDERALAVLHVDQRYLNEEIERQRSEIARGLPAYRGESAEPDPTGRECIVVDDGMATGATAEAAVRSLISRGAKHVVLAVPVAPSQAVDRIRAAGADVVCLGTPEPFYAVGQWYETFDQVTDDEVIDVLRSRP